MMSADDSLPCTKEQFDEIKAILDQCNNGDEPCGSDCEYYGESKALYLFGEEYANIDLLPEQALKKIGALVATAKRTYLECGFALRLGSTLAGFPSFANFGNRPLESLRSGRVSHRFSIRSA